MDEVKPNDKLSERHIAGMVTALTPGSITYTLS